MGFFQSGLTKPSRIKFGKISHIRSRLIMWENLSQNQTDTDRESAGRIFRLSG
jgi:hypothetical protein